MKLWSIPHLAALLALAATWTGWQPVAADSTPPDLQREGRGLWTHFTDVINPDPVQGKKDIQQLVDRMARAHLNLLLPWVRTEYVAALRDPSFPPDSPFARLAEWDALGELIAAAYRREIETHLWYSFTYYKSQASFEMRQHPELAARRLDEVVPDPKTGKTHPPWMTDVCTTHPEAREMELDIVRFLLDRYPQVRGVHIEEPGYGYSGNCFCDLCNHVFRLIYGFDQKDRPDGPEATDLKCLATTDFMRRLRAMMLDRNPELILSANGGYRWQTDRTKGRDWERWTQLGWLDYYVPQIYVTDDDMLMTRARETMSALAGQTEVFVGFSVSPPSIRPRKLSPDEICQAVEAIRKVGASGIVFFWAGAFTDEMAAALGRGPFAQPARLPAPKRHLPSASSSLDDRLVAACRTIPLPETWRFRLDPRNEGDTRGYQQADFDDASWRPLQVARTWESQGIKYDGHAWYRVAFKLPAREHGDWRLHFGGVDGPCWVFLNGRQIGKHERWDEPFDVDLSSAITRGRNALAVHVYDGSGQGGIYKPVTLYALPPNRITNGGFDHGLQGWRSSEFASVATTDSGACLRLAGTGKSDAKAGWDIRLDEPTSGPVLLSFRAKRMGREPAATIGVTVLFTFTDGSSTWFNQPWLLLPTDAGRWVRKRGLFHPPKPVRAISAWCINYRTRQPTLFDDLRLRLFPLPSTP